MKNNMAIETAERISGRQSIMSQVGLWPGYGSQSSPFVKSAVRSSMAKSIQELGFMSNPEDG